MSLPAAAGAVLAAAGRCWLLAAAGWLADVLEAGEVMCMHGQGRLWGECTMPLCKQRHEHVCSWLLASFGFTTVAAGLAIFAAGTGAGAC